jgi:hypothetical protein
MDSDPAKNGGQPGELTGCHEFQQLMKAQLEVMRKHLPRHKWFRHLGSEEEAAMNFVKEYGWIMREMYCSACRLSGECEHARSLREGKIEETPPGIS